MPTVCELKIQAKAKGLRGYSKLKKADLEKLVGGKSSPKKEASPKKADPNKAIPLPPPPAKKKEKKKSTKLNKLRRIKNFMLVHQ